MTRRRLIVRIVAAVIIAPVCAATAQWVPSHHTDASVHPQEEFIYPPGKVTPECHASTLTVLPDGDVLAAWFGGAHEGATDVAIYTARKHQGQWSYPVEVAHAEMAGKGIPTWNPVLFQTGKHRLWLYYKYGAHPSVWKGMRMMSTDEGRTWSQPEALPEGILGPIRTPPLVLPHGLIVSGSSNEGEGGWRVYIERSTNDGKTWERIGPIVMTQEQDIAAKPWPEPDMQSPELRAKDKGARHYSGIIQPSVISLGGRHLRLYARSKTMAARIVIADSDDNGLTWSKTSFLDEPSDNSGIDVIRLKDGRIIMIFNDTPRGRSPLNLAISNDGIHFRVFATLEEGAGEYSYPTIVQAPDGDLDMTYTWHRTSIKFVQVPLAEVPHD